MAMDARTNYHYDYLLSLRHSQSPFNQRQPNSLMAKTIGCEIYLQDWHRRLFLLCFITCPDFILHKIGHIMVFGTLGVSLYWATRYSVTWAIALTAITAACDEWHQYFVPGRSSRFGDVVLDTLAAIVFILLVKFMRQKPKS